MVVDQAQEGRRRREARQALLEALARDHRRGEGGRRRPGEQPRARRTRSRRRSRTRCRRTTSSARSRRAPARTRTPTLRDDRLRGLRARGRRRDRRGADRQPEPHRRPTSATSSRSTAATSARPARSRGSSSAAASCSSRPTASTRTSSLLAAADAGADDVERTARRSRSPRAPEELAGVREAIEARASTVESAELSMVPKTTVAVDDESTAKQVMRLIDALEDNDDVQDVYANFDIPEAVLEAVASLRLRRTRRRDPGSDLRGGGGATGNRRVRRGTCDERAGLAPRGTIASVPAVKRVLGAVDGRAFRPTPASATSATSRSAFTCSGWPSPSRQTRQASRSAPRSPFPTLGRGPRARGGRRCPCRRRVVEPWSLAHRRARPEGGFAAREARAGCR